jgi:hypothetical protein
MARPTEPRASASGRQPRVQVTSDSLRLAVLCCAGVEFFIGFRGPKAHSNRPLNPAGISAMAGHARDRYRDACISFRVQPAHAEVEIWPLFRPAL